MALYLVLPSYALFLARTAHFGSWWLILQPSSSRLLRKTVKPSCCIAFSTARMRSKTADLSRYFTVKRSHALILRVTIRKSMRIPMLKAMMLISPGKFSTGHKSATLVCNLRRQDGRQPVRLFHGLTLFLHSSVVRTYHDLMISGAVLTSRPT